MQDRPATVSTFVPFDWRGFLIALVMYGLEIVGFICLIIVLITWWVATPGDVL